MVWQYQELLYRIEVLEVCKMLLRAAPESANPKDLHWHYQMVDAYFQVLLSERRYGINANENQKQLQNTAYGSVAKVIQDYRKRLSSFSPGSDANCYQKTITDVIHTVLAAWIQYRQTYIEVAKEAAA